MEEDPVWLLGSGAGGFIPEIAPESVLILEEAVDESALRLGSKGFLTISSLSILLSPADFRDSPVRGPAPLELFLNKRSDADIYESVFLNDNLPGSGGTRPSSTLVRRL